MLKQVKLSILCVIFLYCNQAFCRSKQYYVETLPFSPLYDLNGKEVTLDRLDGNVLLVHFWATWCTSCVDELKSLNKLQKLLRKDKVVVIPISEDFKGTDTVKEFYNKFNLKFLPAFWDKNNKWFREMRVSTLPTTFIIDSQGKNVMSMNNKVDWLDKKNINLVKKYISAKQPYNPDYVSLINEHSVVINQSELKDRNKNSSGEKVLRSIETDLAPVIEEDKLTQGEIGMSNAPKEDFKNRRPVNLNYTNSR